MLKQAPWRSREFVLAISVSNGWFQCWKDMLILPLRNSSDVVRGCSGLPPI